MPPTTPPSEQWFQNQLAAMKADIAALKAQRTQYVLDASGNLQAIIGNVAADQNGNATGYSGWGLLSKQAKNTGWTTPTLINSWSNLGGGFETAGYLKDPLGFVHLKGVVHSGTSGTAAFVLPAGFRPGATTDTSTDNAAVVQITAAGNVVCTGTAAVGLSGITFLAEN